MVEVIRGGLARTTGDIVCLHEGASEVDLADLRELWKLRDQEDLVVARHERRRKQGRTGFQMLRRSVINALQQDSVLATSANQVRLRLADQGVLDGHGVELIGATREAIAKAEDRLLFREAMERIGLECPRSRLVTSIADARAALDFVG